MLGLLGTTYRVTRVKCPTCTRTFNDKFNCRRHAANCVGDNAAPMLGGNVARAACEVAFIMSDDAGASSDDPDADSEGGTEDDHPPHYAPHNPDPDLWHDPESEADEVHDLPARPDQIAGTRFYLDVQEAAAGRHAAEYRRQPGDVPRRHRAQTEKYLRLFGGGGLVGDNGIEWINGWTAKFGSACRDTMSAYVVKNSLRRETDHTFSTVDVRLPHRGVFRWKIRHPLVAFAEQLCDEDLMGRDGVRIRHYRETTAEGVPVYTECYYSGDAVEALEGEVCNDRQHDLLIAYSQFVDAAAFDKNMNLKACPIVLELLVFPRWMRHGGPVEEGGHAFDGNDLLRVTIGNVPDLVELYDPVELATFTTADKVAVRHGFVNAALSIFKPHAAGGVRLVVAGPGMGATYNCFFRMAVSPNDTPEGNTMLVRTGGGAGKTRFACRCCWAPRVEASKLCAADNDWDCYRTTEDIRAAEVLFNEAQTAGDKQQLTSALSTHDLPTSTYLVFDGTLVGSERYGPYAVFLPDFLHTLRCGQEPRLREAILAILAAHDFTRAELLRYGAALSHDFQHQSDRTLVNLRCTTNLQKPGKVSNQDQRTLLLQLLLSIPVTYDHVDDDDDVTTTFTKKKKISSIVERKIEFSKQYMPRYGW